MPPGVRVILLNSVYVGKVKFAGTEYDGRHRPLITEEDFQAAQSCFFRRSGTQENSAQKNPLSGQIPCCPD